MRTLFFELLHKQMREDETIFLLIADVGLGLVEPIQKEFPDRFLNVGIAEQNMIGIAAGLCNAGFKPVCYTWSNFLIHRCFEQIRNDICLHKYPVILLGTTTGYDNAILGPTHHILDDIGCLKALPNMRIYSPGSVETIREIFDEVNTIPGPAYIRIGKGSLQLERNPGINHRVFERKDPSLLVVTHGTTLETCIKAAESDKRFSLFCLNRVLPLESDKLEGEFREYSKGLVVEDHIKGTGLYNSLCQFVMDKGLDIRLYSLAPDDRFEEMIGSRDYLASRSGLSPEGISRKISEILN